MSGGTWDYNQFRIEQGLKEMLEEDEDMEYHNLKEDFPKLYKYFKELAEVLPKVIHDLDWAYAGDTIIDDKEAFEKEALSKLKKLL